MSLCNRLIGGIFDRLDTIASFWQTPREVEWAKAAKLAGNRADLLANHGAIFADGLAKREAEEEVAEPLSHWKVGDSYCGLCGENITSVSFHACPMRTETSAPTPGAVDGPAEGEPPEPSAGVGPNSPKWIRDLIEATEDFVGVPRGTCYGPLESADLAESSAESRACRAPGPFDCLGCGMREACTYPAHSAEVEPPASAPAAESPAPEFDWVTTANPVIAGVLAEHKFLPIMGRCECPSLPRVADWQRWSEHVAPHIAIAIQSDFLSTIYEDTTFAINAFSGDRPRPLADFPKHQIPRM